MKKWNLIIDVDNCTNCNMCTLASKDEHVGNAFPGYSAEMPKRGAEWIKIEKKERGQTPMIDIGCLLYTSPSPRDKRQSRMPSSA